MTAISLVDGFSRPITYLRISVTDKCNLRCIYCMPEGGLPWLHRDEILSYEEITALVRAAASVGVRTIRLTGGEPLVRRHLSRLVSAISEVRGIEDIALSTNGLLLREQLSDLVAAGLRRINFSLDTLRPNRFEAIARRAGLDTVLAAIDATIEAGLAPIKVNCVVMRGRNEDELIDFARLTRDRPIFVRFIEVMPVVENVELQRDAYVSSQEILQRLSSDGELSPTIGPSGNGPARYYAYAGRRGCRRRDQPALARLLRTLQPRAADGGRAAAALPLRRLRARSAHAASRRAPAPSRSPILLRSAMLIKPERHHLQSGRDLVTDACLLRDRRLSKAVDA